MSQTLAISRDAFVTDAIFGPPASTSISERNDDEPFWRSMRAFKASYSTPIYPLSGFIVGPCNFYAPGRYSTFDDEPIVMTLSGAIRAPQSFLPTLRTLAYAKCSAVGYTIGQTALIASDIAGMWISKPTAVEKIMLPPMAPESGPLEGTARGGPFDKQMSDAVRFLLQTAVTVFNDAPGGVFHVTNEPEVLHYDTPDFVESSGAVDRHVLAARDLRDWLNLTNEDLGKLVGIAEGTIYNWSRTGARPRRSTARRLFRIHSFLRSLNASVGGDRARTWLATGNPSPLDMLKSGAVDEVETLAADLVFARVRPIESPLVGAGDEPKLTRPAALPDTPKRDRTPQPRKLR